MTPAEIMAKATEVAIEATSHCIDTDYIPWASEQDRLQCEMDAMILGIELTETIEGKRYRRDPACVVYSADKKTFTVKV